MQIIIDIDVRAYNKSLKLAGDEDGGILGMHLINAVANGAPLPKGHGRLIDANEVGKYVIIGNADLRKCPTIIEADNEN